MTRGGAPTKTITVFIAGTNVGKSLVMCHLAARHLVAGRNVLYVTLEMSEKDVGERIDANLMNAEVNDLLPLGRERFSTKMDEINRRTTGRLVVKEFPTAAANVSHLRYLLDELRMKSRFVPDVVYVDYLNIMASYRYRKDGGVGSYHYVKSVAEELRGLAVEKDFPVITASQFNREGHRSSDPEMGDTSESFGMPMTADFLAAIVLTDDLEDQGLYLFKVLKNRFNSKMGTRRKFFVGVDIPRMTLRNVDPETTGTTEQVPASRASEGADRGSRPKRDFSGFE